MTQSWGLPGDVPVPLDRDGDGRVELGVFRRATGDWFFKNHLTDATETFTWGLSGDIPLGRVLPPVQVRFGDYDGDRKADLSVYRPSTGGWFLFELVHRHVRFPHALLGPEHGPSAARRLRR